jgi:hypothetical protein
MEQKQDEYISSVVLEAGSTALSWIFGFPQKRLLFGTALARRVRTPRRHCRQDAGATIPAS